jgi:hypothetical protein
MSEPVILAGLGPEYKIPLIESELAVRPGYEILHRVRGAALLNAVLFVRVDEKGIRGEGGAPRGLARITRYLEAHSLRVQWVRRKAGMIRVRGTAHALRATFHVELFVFDQNTPTSTGRYRGHLGPVYVPAEFPEIERVLIGGSWSDFREARSAGHSQLRTGDAVVRLRH